MSSGGDNGGQDFDLNLAPIIDCFTVLITYMLVSASFLSLGVLEVGVAASGTGDAKAVVPAEALPTLLIEIKKGNVLGLKLSGGAKSLNLSQSAGPISGKGWDMKAMTAWVLSAKRDFPALTEATLQVEPGVQYHDLIRIIETLKKNVPKVYLGAGT